MEDIMMEELAVSEHPALADRSTPSDADDEEERLFHGIPPPDTHCHLGRMARYMGLADAEAMRRFLQGLTFKPYFDILWEKAILPRLRGHGGQGPRLSHVVAELSKGQIFGYENYAHYYRELSTFSPLERYARCLFDLRSVHTLDNKGLFWGRLHNPMTSEEIDSRLWCCMSRAAHDRTKAYKKIRKSTKIPSKTQSGADKEVEISGESSLPERPKRKRSPDTHQSARKRNKSSHTLPGAGSQDRPLEMQDNSSIDSGESNASFLDDIAEEHITTNRCRKPKKEMISYEESTDGDSAEECSEYLDS